MSKASMGFHGTATCVRADQILKSILLAVLTLATLNLVLQIQREAEAAYVRQRLYEEHGVTVCKLHLSQDESSRFLIELGLILSFLGSVVKGRLGKIASLLGLVWSVGVYAQWWRYYFRLMEFSGAGSEGIKHIFYLYDAVWFDVCIAAVLPLLILWQATSLGLSFGLRDKISGPGLRSFPASET